MALSTMIHDTVQTPAASWKFELSDDSFRRSPNINYIYVPTTVEFKKKIISVIETIRFLPCHLSVLAQYWAAKEIGNTVVLTTTRQPFGLWGDNNELLSYHKGCSDHKLYVHPKEGVAFGLSGRVFLNRTPEQTQNVHRYPKDQRPPCEDGIFSKIWRAFAMPVIEDNKCVGALEFIIDTPKDSYDIDIGVASSALEHAGFQSPNTTNCPTKTYVHDRKRLRRTKSFEITRYCCLVPYFGLSSSHVASKLGVKTSTFRNACRNVGIPEWPWISNSTTTRASFDLETQIKPPASETSSFETMIAAESMPCISNLEWPLVQSMITQAHFSEYVTSQIDHDSIPFETQISIDQGSIGSPTETDYMALFGFQLDDIPNLSSLFPHWDVGSGECSYTQDTATTEASLRDNQINQIAYEPYAFVTSYASATSSFGDPITTEGRWDF